MKHIRIPILFLALALAAAACVKLGGQPLVKRYYRITPERTAEAVPPQDDTILKVRRLSVSELYDTRELVYQMRDGRIESDFYNLFFVTPGNNLTAELRHWLAASGRFAHIVEPGSLVVPSLTLEGVVNALYGDYSSDSPAAVVDMQFFVVDEATSGNEVIFSGNYHQRVPFAAPDPAQLVQAMTQGVQAIFDQLEQDLKTAPLTR
ncbi:hypothetical protein GM415_11880 [Pseudodesulfovibrio cashew]|uniref:ABC-type transport auxiliary lipoprotein component domain-containing protein n=1 Tax=Pseudodesulfovibrio cashew TaxID=2678688 RepID=A0A6I6JKD4_9BACT|nr:ABC-type transport auxiliary lipoprotein family protein [Pseudodesulfovibrio cashew]QGY40793.1 hypothetical protein GM415_11880 [Pseudodesulfovibrio cashew]